MAEPVTREAALAAYLKAAARLPFVLGQHDCGTYVAGWVQKMHGFDPMLDLRGRYATEAELAAVLGPRGLPWFAARLARRAGLKPSLVHAAGTVAVIAGGGAALCAIHTGYRWAARDRNQLICVLPESVRVICAYEV